MKKITFQLLMIVGLGAGICNNTAFSQVTLQWAKGMGAITIYDQGLSIAVDASGNVYTTGSFGGTVDFDPGVGTCNLTSAGGHDIFISKLDAAGNLVWAKGMGASGNEIGSSIAVDASGNVYSTGSFADTVDFDPGPGTSNLTSAGYYSSFISKLDTAGNFVWAKRIERESLSIALDDSGNVYTTGGFTGTADFDPGAGTSFLTSIGLVDIFISKLDALGNFVLARSMGGAGSDWGHTIAVDASGNAYITGAFEGTVDFDPGAGITNFASAGGTDIFISKLDAAGNFTWAKGLGGASINERGYSIAVDDSGNVYTTGIFGGTVDFDQGVGTSNLTSAGGADIFISKLDAAGNFIWAKGMGGVNSEICQSIAVDASGNAYITGEFDGTVDFDPGVGINNLISVGAPDIFIFKLDATGNFVWAINMGGTSYDYSISIAVDASGNVYTTGFFAGTTDFDPGAGTSYLTSAGGADIFIHKISQNPVGVTELYSVSMVYVYPNPCMDKATISFSLSHPTKISIKLFDVEGRLISILAEKICEEGVNEFIWNAEAMEAGIYFLSMQSDKFKHTERIIVLK